MPSILETVGPRSGSAPLTYTLSEQGTVDVMSIFAHFNGASAGGTFRPMVTIRSQNGAILARGVPSDSVAAGDSADVTFAPFLREGSASTPGGGGIDFDTYPQAGTWFYAETTGDAGAPNGYGLELLAAKRINIESTADNLDITANDGTVTIASVSGTDTGFVQIDADGSAQTSAGNVFFTLAQGRGGEVTVRQGGSNESIFSVYETGEAEFYMPFDGNYVAFYGELGTALMLTKLDSAVRMPHLPILDPGAPGQLWNDAGTVKVSL